MTLMRVACRRLTHGYHNICAPPPIVRCVSRSAPLIDRFTEPGNFFAALPRPPPPNVCNQSVAQNGPRATRSKILQPLGAGAAMIFFRRAQKTSSEFMGLSDTAGLEQINSYQHNIPQRGRRNRTRLFPMSPGSRTHIPSKSIHPSASRSRLTQEALGLHFPPSLRSAMTRATTAACGHQADILSAIGVRLLVKISQPANLKASLNVAMNIPRHSQRRRVALPRRRHPSEEALGSHNLRSPGGIFHKPKRIAPRPAELDPGFNPGPDRVRGNPVLPAPLSYRRKRFSLGQLREKRTE